MNVKVDSEIKKQNDFIITFFFISTTSDILKYVLHIDVYHDSSLLDIYGAY
jgi:hypothetical protein